MTRTITALSVQKRDKERVNVFLDHQYAFSLNLHVALGLKCGQHLSQADIERLQQEDEAHRAYHHALRLLDDAAFARAWLDNRERFRPRGARAIHYELRQKGVARDIIDEVVTDLDEEASAWAAVEGKLERWRTLDQDAFRKKVMGFLSRRGFRYDTVRTVCRRAWQTIAGSDR
jgi:regulatory protein